VQGQKIAAHRIKSCIHTTKSSVAAIDLLSYWLGYTSFSSSHHSKEKIRDPFPLLVSFSPSKNTGIIERRLQQIDWKCGKKVGGENE
jgi:hypothetical protein